VWLSPPGRGRMLTHGLLPEEKLEKVRRELGMAATSVVASAPVAPEASTGPMMDRAAEVEESRAAAEPPRASVDHGAMEMAHEARIADLERTVKDLHERLAALEEALGG